MTTESRATRDLSPEEREFAALLMRNGWAKEEAEAEAVRSLADAAEEDGYDGS